MKYFEEGWNRQGIMLTIRIECDDQFIIFPEDRLKTCPESRPLPEITGMFQEMSSKLEGNLSSLIYGTIIHYDRIEAKGSHLLQNRTDGPLGIIGRDENTDFS
jgi:hypothetical protein